MPGFADEAFRFLGNAAFSGVAGELRIVQNTGFLVLEGEINGDGLADFAIRLDGLATLTVGSIII